ncbi:MAG: hypothetical protein ACRDRL_14160 [Sciscionella sp.]
MGQVAHLSRAPQRIRVSVVLPIIGCTSGLTDAVRDYAQSIACLEERFEILLACGGSERSACQDTAAVVEAVRVVEDGVADWGRLVRVGVAGCRGEIICFANWKPTAPGGLAEILAYALRNPEVVFRANRRMRRSFWHRLGSLLFNLECRAILGTTAWDINGTPKVFARARSELFRLTRSDGLLDAEFAVVCERAGYPIAEVPIQSRGDAGEDRVDYRRALSMYFGVLGLRRHRDK